MPDMKTPTEQANENSRAEAQFDLEIPHEKLGSLTEVEGVLIAESKGEGVAETDILVALTAQGGKPLVGRKCRKRTAALLADKWSKFGRGLPKPGIRTSLMGGFVFEWEADGAVLEFSRKAKRCWLDIASPEGDWGTEINLRKKGWKKLRETLNGAITSPKQ